MEEVKLETIAQLMFEQSGEEVDIKSIVKLPDNGGPAHMSYNRHDVYAARTDSYTCLVYLYGDGRVHVYVH